MSFSAKHIPPTLFWDVDYSKLDWTKHKILIVQRVIERGSYKALKEIIYHYGKAKLEAIIKDLPYLNPRDIAFVSIYFNISLIELRCYSKKPLNPNYLN